MEISQQWNEKLLWSNFFSITTQNILLLVGLPVPYLYRIWTPLSIPWLIDEKMTKEQERGFLWGLHISNSAQNWGSLGSTYQGIQAQIVWHGLKFFTKTWEEYQRNSHAIVNFFLIQACMGWFFKWDIRKPLIFFLWCLQLKRLQLYMLLSDCGCHMTYTNVCMFSPS